MSRRPAISSASASVEVPTSTPIEFAHPDQPRRRARDRGLGRRILPAPAREGGFGGVEDLAPADADRPAVGPREQALLLERPQVAAHGHVGDREIPGDFRDRDEAVAVDQFENAGVAGARRHAARGGVGFRCERGVGGHARGVQLERLW